MSYVAEIDPVSSTKIDPSQLRRLGYLNQEAFINILIPEELTFPVPELHEVVLKKMLFSTSSRLCFALPRGTAKSTLAKIAVVWFLLYSEHVYCLYVSATHTNAVNYVKSIIEMMHTPNFISLYGKPEMLIERNSDGHYQFILTKYFYDENGNERQKVKTCIIQCKGAQQAVRGLNINNRRPSLLFLDDIEKKEEMRNEQNYKNLKDWFYGTLLKALDKRNQRVIQIGNLVSQQCLLNDNLNNTKWETMRFGILKQDGTSLWPDLWSVEEIISDYEDYLAENQVATWFAEMMNYPMPPSGGVIRLDEIHFVPQIGEVDQYQYGFMTIDLAISKKQWSHDTIVAIHIFDGIRWVIADTLKISDNDPIRLFEILVSLSKRWKINYIGIETVAYQQVLLPVYDYFAKTKGIKNLKFVGCPARDKKSERINTWAGLIRNKTYALSVVNQELLNQLLNFDPTADNNKDDYPDACAHGPFMIKKYGHKIRLGYIQNEQADEFIYHHGQNQPELAELVRY